MQLVTQTPPSSRSVQLPPRILVADSDPESRAAIEASLSGLGTSSLSHAKDGAELEAQFFGPIPFDLVLCRADMGARTSLLARARSVGRRASFIVYSDVGPWLRVYVSDSRDTLLSSRVIAIENLASLAAGLLDAARR